MSPHSPHQNVHKLGHAAPVGEGCQRSGTRGFETLCAVDDELCGGRRGEACCGGGKLSAPGGVVDHAPQDPEVAPARGLRDVAAQTTVLVEDLADVGGAMGDLEEASELGLEDLRDARLNLS